MSEKNEELRSKFNKQPVAPPPPPRKKKRGNADIVAKLISDDTPKETEGKSVDKSESMDGTDRTALITAQPELPLDMDLSSEVQTVQTGNTVQPIQTGSTEWLNETVKKTFKFKRSEALKLEKMAHYHRLTMTDLIRMGLLMAYAELESVEKSKEKM